MFHQVTTSLPQRVNVAIYGAILTWMASVIVASTTGLLERLGPLADFVVAVGTGLTFTLLGDPRMEVLTTLPMALVPLFGVGLSGASHLVVLGGLLDEEP